MTISDANFGRFPFRASGEHFFLHGVLFALCNRALTITDAYCSRFTFRVQHTTTKNKKIKKNTFKQQRKTKTKIKKKKKKPYISPGLSLQDTTTLPTNW